MGSPVEPQLGHGAVARLLRGALAVLITTALISAYVSVNFFFYFTVLSNILAAILMAVMAVRPPSHDGQRADPGSGHPLHDHHRVGLCPPALFLAVSLIRGSVIDFYPYPFLDPGETGYAGVAGYSTVILVLFLAVGAFIRWWGNARGRELSIVPQV